MLIQFSFFLPLIWSIILWFSRENKSAKETVKSGDRILNVLSRTCFVEGRAPMVCFLGKEMGKWTPTCMWPAKEIRSHREKVVMVSWHFKSWEEGVGLRHLLRRLSVYRQHGFPENSLLDHLKFIFSLSRGWCLNSWVKVNPSLLHSFPPAHLR